MEVYNSFNLKNILWYKIGGTVKYLLECKSRQDIIESVEFLKKNSIERYFVVGLGANLLFTDDFFDGAVIYITHSDELQIKRIGDTKVKAYAGEEIKSVCEFAFTQNLLGLEWAGGLPGTVGAGVRGNVGAFGGEFKDSIQEAEVIDVKTGAIQTLSNPKLHFSYRHSFVKDNRNLIVLTATFEFKKATKNELKKAQTEYGLHCEFRNQNHPHEYPNSGSTFKNITGENVQKVLAVFPGIKELVDTKWHGKASVGYLNTKLGFSGFKVGGAQVSQKHRNFINNMGNATQRDVIAVISAIQEKYQQTFGFMPEPEVEIVK